MLILILLLLMLIPLRARSCFISAAPLDRRDLTQDINGFCCHFPTTFDVEFSELFFLSVGWSYLTKLILERRQSKILFVSLIWNAHLSMNLLLHDFRMNLNIVMIDDKSINQDGSLALDWSGVCFHPFRLLCLLHVLQVKKSIPAPFLSTNEIISIFAAFLQDKMAGVLGRHVSSARKIGWKGK